MPVLSTLAVLASVGGTVAQVVANNNAQDAVNAARQQELLRQKKITDEAAQTFNKNLPTASRANMETEQNKGAAQRLALLRGIQSAGQQQPIAGQAPDASYTVTGATGQPQNTATGRTGAATRAWADSVNGAAARLGGYEDAATQQNIGVQQANNELRTLDNRARGNANVAGLELEQASHAGDNLSGWGSILSGLGTVAGLGSATGAFKGSARTATPTKTQFTADDYANLGPLVPVGGQTSATFNPYAGWGG